MYYDVACSPRHRGISNGFPKGDNALGAVGLAVRIEGNQQTGTGKDGNGQPGRRIAHGHFIFRISVSVASSTRTKNIQGATRRGRKDGKNDHLGQFNTTSPFQHDAPFSTEVILSSHSHHAAPAAYTRSGSWLLGLVLEEEEAAIMFRVPWVRSTPTRSLANRSTSRGLGLLSR